MSAVESVEAHPGRPSASGDSTLDPPEPIRGSASDLESMEATIELLSDWSAVARIREADEAIARGEGTTVEEMAELMAQRKARDRAA